MKIRTCANGCIHPSCLFIHISKVPKDCVAAELAGMADLAGKPHQLTNDGATTPMNYDLAAQKEIAKHLRQTTHGFKFGRLLLIIFTVLVLLYFFAMIFVHSGSEPIPSPHDWPR